MNNQNLRKIVKILIIETGYDKVGHQKKLAHELGISPQSLCMALTGYRHDTPGSEKILKDAQRYLRKQL